MTSSLPRRPPLRPRRHVHRGVVEASAILLDEALLDPLTARRRAIAAWSPGVTVHRIRAGALLVRFPAPRLMDCARAPGLSLVRAGKEASAPLASAPLDGDELAALAAPPGAVVIVRGGVAESALPTDADAEDPALYLDAVAFAVVSVAPLGPPPGSPKIVGAQTNFRSRGALGVGEAPAAMGDVVAAMRAWKQGAPAAPARAAQPSMFAALLRAIAALFARLFGPAPAGAIGAAGAGSGKDKRALVMVSQERAGPSLVDRVGARLRDLFARALVHARLASFIGRRQAEYVDRMLGMFERGELDEALRHAIPLADEGEGEETSAPPAIGVPSPRSGLAISGGSRGKGGAIYSPPDFYAELQRRYRAAFERLEKEGRVDEAAFVLAELLRETAEAVSFLERHQRYRLAAELAEARGLAPALLVRQWMLAGDARRAVLLARRHGVFGEAIGRIGARPEGVVLRVLWAETLAEAGDFAAAVETAYPVEGARGLAAAWIDAAIAQGGVAAARMLARKLALFPPSFTEVRERVRALCEDEGATPEERRAFAEALREGGATPAMRTLARPLLRALVRDGARSGDPLTLSVVSRVAHLANDEVVRADLPVWPTVDRVELKSLSTPRRLQIASGDAGPTAIHDAVQLPDGRAALALGEAGVRVIARDGRVIVHLDEPAHHLVISDRGDRALSLARRGAAYRIARLDLVGRRSEPWCDARLQAFAPDFDGALWIVATSGKLLEIDALDSRFDAIAAIDLGQGTTVGSIGRWLDLCAVDTAIGLRRYALPSFTLRGARDLDLSRPSAETRSAVSAHEGGGIVRLARSAGRSKIARVFLEHHGFDKTTRRVDVELSEGATPLSGSAPPRLAPLSGSAPPRLGPLSGSAPPRPAPLAIAARPQWIACAVGTADGVMVRLFDEAALQLRYEIALCGAARASLRFLQDTLTIGDDRGRVIAVELAHGGLVRDARV